jgi:hypothetical protein
MYKLFLNYSTGTLAQFNNPSYLNDRATGKRANLKNHIQDAGLARKVIWNIKAQNYEQIAK